MSEPWWDPNKFGAMYGIIGGGIGGGIGGLMGALAGILVPRGIGRRWILPIFYLLFVFGVAQLLFGIYAVIAGQPWGIWYGPVLCGFIMTTVIGGLIPMLRMRYREAEDRKIMAEALRKN